MSENLVSMGVPGTEGNFQIPKENCTHLHFKIEFKKKKKNLDMWFFFQREEVLANTGLAFLSSTSY